MLSHEIVEKSNLLTSPQFHFVYQMIVELDRQDPESSFIGIDWIYYCLNKEEKISLKELVSWLNILESNGLIAFATKTGKDLTLTSTYVILRPENKQFLTLQ